MPKDAGTTMSRPAAMTKSALQKELRKKQIKFDSTALKADLVALYESNILRNSAEFSTDDDEPLVKITRSTGMSFRREKRGTAARQKAEEPGSGDAGPRRSPRKPKKTLRLIEEDEERLVQKSRENLLSITLQRIDNSMDGVTALTDKQLIAALKKQGIKFGPIGPTTRKVYEKRLREALKEEREETPVPVEEYSDEETSEEEEVEVVEIPKSVTRSQIRKVLEKVDIQSAPDLAKTIDVKSRDFRPNTLVKSPAFEPCLAQSSPAWEAISFDSKWGSPNPNTLVKSLRPNGDVATSGLKNVRGVPDVLVKTPVLGKGGLACGLANLTAESLEPSPSNDPPGGTDEKTPVRKVAYSQRTEVAIEESVFGDPVAGDLALTPKAACCLDSFESSPYSASPSNAGCTPYHRSALPRLPPSTNGSSISALTRGLLSPRLAKSEYTRRIKAICDSATKRRPLHSKTMIEEETIVKEAVEPKPQCKMTKPVAGTPLWVTIAIMAAAVAFLYFVYITMEENPHMLPFGKSND